MAWFHQHFEWFQIQSYTLFHEIFSTFFFNKISLPEPRNKRKIVFGNNKNVLFLNLNDNIIEQEMNKLAIHTHVNFRPRNTMFFLLNNYVLSGLATMTSLLSFMVNLALVNRARFRKWQSFWENGPWRFWVILNIFLRRGFKLAIFPKFVHGNKLVIMWWMILLVNTIFILNHWHLLSI